MQHLGLVKILLVIGILPAAWFARRFIPIALICRYPDLLLFSRKDYYLYCLFSMFAKVSRADGQVGKEELSAIVDFMNDSLDLDDREKSLARQVFNEQKANTAPIEEFALKFFRKFADQPGILANIVDVLLWLSMSDHSFRPSEEDLITRISDTFGISRARYQGLRDSNLQEAGLSTAGDNDEERGERSSPEPRAAVEPGPYAVLGCKSTDSWDQIKSRYRRLIKEHHPDRLRSRGLPKQLLDRANRRSQELVEAFDELRRLRGVV